MSPKQRAWEERGQVSIEVKQGPYWLDPWNHQALELLYDSMAMKFYKQLQLIAHKPTKYRKIPSNEFNYITITGKNSCWFSCYLFFIVHRNLHKDHRVACTATLNIILHRLPFVNFLWFSLEQLDIQNDDSHVHNLYEEHDRYDQT